MAVLLEIVGVHCAGKTTFCRFLEVLGCKCVLTKTQHCVRVDNVFERQRCFFEAIASAYNEARRLLEKSRCVVIDNSLLSVASYNAFYGLPYSNVISTWRKIKAMLGVETLLLIVDPDTLRNRCRMRRRENWEWEAKTAPQIQKLLLKLADRSCGEASTL